ncbi:MAG TPA: undecaprenyl-diphosphate phosphatase [Rugosimonospora sp.]|nr:undecaprenyl-diphosphate phosphatase [Rugosimonospora sp.]
MSSHLSYAEAIIVGALQGVTELFPVSSLGHSVLIPALIGGGWARDLNVSTPESPYLAYIVGLHVATAIALLVFFWRDWVRILTGLYTSLRYRRIQGADERLAWMIVIGTIPVGLSGLLLEHTFRTTLGRPVPAAVFLILNGAMLYGAERLRRRAARQATAPALVSRTGRAAVFSSANASGAAATTTAPGVAEQNDPAGSDLRISRRGFVETTLIAAAQILALLPGISRSGVTMGAGLLRGLSHEDAARFSFLLATPVILAAGVLKVPDLFGSQGTGIHGQVLAGSVASGVCAYVAVRFLTRYFETRTLTPFAVYCVLAGLGSLAWLTIA